MKRNGSWCWGFRFICCMNKLSLLFQCSNTTNIKKHLYHLFRVAFVSKRKSFKSLYVGALKHISSWNCPQRMLELNGNKTENVEWKTFFFWCFVFFDENRKPFFSKKEKKLFAFCEFFIKSLPETHTIHEWVVYGMREQVVYKLLSFNIEVLFVFDIIIWQFMNTANGFVELFPHFDSFLKRKHSSIKGEIWHKKVFFLINWQCQVIVHGINLVRKPFSLINFFYFIFL